jgi:hypothetical protein
MKCWNSGFNAQGSRVIIVVVQVEAVKICVPAMEALRKNEKKGWNSSFSWISPVYEQTQGSGAGVFLTLLGSAPTGTGTIALDSTFGSFTLLEPVSHEVNRVFRWKCLDCLDRNEVFLALRVCTQCTTSYSLAGPACSWCLVDTSIICHMNVLTPSSSYDVKTLVKNK